MLREIACKTLTGRGRINYSYERELRLDNVSKTLGCWIINLNYEAKYEGNDLYLDGYYSIQLWYAKDNDQSSSVYEEKINFHEKAIMVYRDVQVISNDKAIKIFVNKYPNAVYMKLNDDNSISLRIEGLYFVDVFQEAIIVIESKDNMKPDMTLDEELLLNVNPNYLTNKE